MTLSSGHLPALPVSPTQVWVEPPTRTPAARHRASRLASRTPPTLRVHWSLGPTAQSPTPHAMGFTGHPVLLEYTRVCVCEAARAAPASTQLSARAASRFLTCKSVQLPSSELLNGSLLPVEKVQAPGSPLQLLAFFLLQRPADTLILSGVTPGDHSWPAPYSSGPGRQLLAPPFLTPILNGLSLCPPCELPVRGAGRRLEFCVGQFTSVHLRCLHV